MKTKVNIKIYDVTDWETNHCNTQIFQSILIYLSIQIISSKVNETVEFGQLK